METEYNKKGLKIMEDKFVQNEIQNTSKETVSVGIIKDLVDSFDNQLDILRKQKKAI